MKEIVTYLTFKGNAREAMQFYADALDGNLHLMTAGDSGQAAEADKDLIMHARLGGPKGTLLMASDVLSHMPMNLVAGNNFSVSLDCDSAEEEQKFFDNLAAGGTITMPLQDTFWGARFGMLIDKFGIAWMFNYDQPKA